LLILALVVSVLVAGFGPGASLALAAFTTSAGVSFSAVETQATGTITVATFTTDTPGDTFTAGINWGDGSPIDPGTVVSDGGGNFHVTAPTHTYAEDGSYTFTVTIIESGASPDTVTPTGTATVGEFSLSLQSLLTNQIHAIEGQSFTGTLATFTDSGSPDPGTDFTAVIDWGDGTTDITPLSGGPGSYNVVGSHVYADEGTYTFSVQAFENNQPNFNVQVTNTATITEGDSLTAIGKTITIPAGQPFSGTVATFADTYPGATASDFTATINWGDATTSAGTITGSAGGPFTVSGSHTYAAPGQYTVTVTLTDDAPGTATATAVTTINAAAPPTLVKSFGAASIPVGGSTTLNFVLANPNDFATLTGVDFTDTLPAGLAIANPNGVNVTCSGGSGVVVLAPAAGNTITVSNGTLGPSGACSIAVNVTGVAPGTQNNTTGPVASNGGTGNPATASITVIAAPVAAKSFTPPVIPLLGTSTLTITITNPNPTTALVGVGFTDALPAGLVVSTPNGLNSTCGGTPFAASNSGVVSLAGGTVAGGASCTYSVNVTGISLGIDNNSVQVTSTNGGNSNTASATITVAQPPALVKSFGAATIPVGGSTSLTFTITNPNPTITLHGIGFMDTLPAGLVISTPNGLTGSCGGGTITATAGTSTVTLSGATLAASASCTFSVNVNGVTAGVQANTTSAVTSTEAGNGNTATASITVLAAPVIAKSFGAAAIAPGGTTSLTFSISNPNSTVALTGVAFTDTLPSGLVVSTPNSLTGSCGGGTITATAGSGTISLAGATLPPSGNCTFSLNVTSTGSTGLLSNSVQITSANGGTGNTSTTAITVAHPARIVKGFAVGAVAVRSPVKLTFQITNPNTFALTGAGFTDIMPLGLLVATPNRLAGSCGGGTITATANTNVISLTGATLAANSTCTFSVYVIGTSFGWKHNITSPVTAANAPAGNVAVATILI
jgi:uncharacterized repeat protein (TIGR01451 family)